MSSPSLALARAKLEAALSEVSTAEGLLESVLRELQGGVRAEKITVSTTVEQAFTRLRAARVDLAIAHEQLLED